MFRHRNYFGLIILITEVFFSSLLHAQVFHFQNFSTTIIKTIAQSPAHDYIEIFNDAGVDTTLTWKADVTGVPAAWTITFDDQNNFYTGVQTGDSADFTLYDSLQFPQKLIIGAFTNNVAATGSVFIDVYNPADTSSKITIEYLFIITNPVGLESAEAETQNITINNNKILFSSDRLLNYRILSESGNLIFSGKTKDGYYDFSSLARGVYFVCMSDEKKFYAKKFVK